MAKKQKKQSRAALEMGIPRKLARELPRANPDKGVKVKKHQRGKPKKKKKIPNFMTAGSGNHVFL